MSRILVAWFADPRGTLSPTLASGNLAAGRMVTGGIAQLEQFISACNIGLSQF